MREIVNYTLDASGNPVPCNNTIEWAKWFQSANRTVAWTNFPGGVSISTVFLGIDHDYTLSATPVLWETLVFHDRGSESELDIMERYTSRGDAVSGHERIVRRVGHLLGMTDQQIDELGATKN